MIGTGNRISNSNAPRNYIDELSNRAMTIASDIEKYYGVYKRRELLVRHSILSNDGTEVNIVDTLIKPTPRITLLSPSNNLLFKDSGIDLSQSDYEVTNIPTTYSIDFLHANIVFYIIEPQFNSDLTKIIGGLFCKPVLRSEKKIVQRILTLRQEADTPSYDDTYYKIT